MAFPPPAQGHKQIPCQVALVFDVPRLYFSGIRALPVQVSKSRTAQQRFGRQCAWNGTRVLTISLEGEVKEVGRPVDQAHTLSDALHRSGASDARALPARVSAGARAWAKAVK